MKNICQVCNKEYNVKPSHSAIRKHCSRECQMITKKEKALNKTNKKCTLCNKVKPINEFWKKTNNVIQSYCIECGTEKNKEDYKKHKLSITEQKQKYYTENKVKIISNVTAWNKEHPKQRSKYMVLENIKRRAKINNADNNFKRKDWLNVLKVFDNKCCYCSSDIKLSIDHFIPLTKKGNHTKNNIVPACMVCNNRKNNKDTYTWIVANFGVEKYNEIIDYLNSTE